MRTAIFDLGSTSFHAFVVDLDDEGVIERVARSRETLHLAAAAAHSGHVPPEAVFRALRAAKQLRKAVDRTAPDVVIASATSALRDASNGDHLIERLETVLRTPIRLLDGSAEAKLAFRGATHGLRVGDEEVLVADLGGGSLDVAVGRPGDITFTDTFQLGASRLTALHVSNDPPAAFELQAIESAVLDACGPLADRLAGHLPMRVIVAGGTGRALARLAVESDDVNGVVIPTARLHAITRRLTGMSSKRRIQLEHVQAKRADILPAGALVLSTLLDALDAGALTVSQSGLREGLLLELIDELEGAPTFLAR